MCAREVPDSRIVELDAVRGIAAGMVLLCHLPRGFWFGETGVDLFFVLSGFLISGIILRNRNRPGFLHVFYVRRALRIFPIYYLALLGMVAVNSLRRHPGELTGLPYYLTYAQNVPLYWGGATPPLGLSVGHTWTLAIEEQFYLLWPLILMFANQRVVPLLCMAMVFASCGLRASGLERVSLMGHLDGLALGGLLAWIELAYGDRFRRTLHRSYCGIAVIGFAAYWLLWSYASSQGISGKHMIKLNFGILLISIAYAGLIGFVQSSAATGGIVKHLRQRWLIWLGTVSYGLYLYHWILYEYADTIIKFGLKQGDPYWLDVLKVAVSLIAAGVSWKFIEQPLLRFKDRFTYGKQAAIAPQAAMLVDG